MNDQIRRYAPVAMVLLVLGWIGWGWLQEATTTDRERIERMLVDLREGVKQKDANGILAYVAADYSDDLNGDRDTLEQRVKGYLLAGRGEDLFVAYEEERVEIDGESACVGLLVRADRRTQYLLESFSPDRWLTLHLAKRGGDWRVHRAEAGPPKPPASSDTDADAADADSAPTE